MAQLTHLKNHNSIGKIKGTTKTSVLNDSAQAYSSKLTQILNHNISIASFPDLIAFKQCDVTDKDRPRSMLSNFSRIFEKLIYNQTFEFMNCQNLFTGFRKNHDTQGWFPLRIKQRLQ